MLMSSRPLSRIANVAATGFLPPPSLAMNVRLLPFLLLLCASLARAGENWKELLGGSPKQVWRTFADQWITAGDAKLDEKNPKKLVAVPGKGVLVNGPGRVRDLVTKETFTDVEVHVEFMVPKDRTRA